MKLSEFLRRFFPPSRGQVIKKLAEEFERRFGFRFRNPALLTEALTHRSYIHFNQGAIASNERLEYLGDSVLGLIISEYLYQTYPDYDEGELTKAKAVLVNETTLAYIGQEYGLNKMIFISPEEEKSGGRNRSSIISDAVEATIAAIFLDSGLEAARGFVRRVLISNAGDILSDSAQRNYKGELLEFLQSRGIEPPRYEVVSEEGPDHEKTFKVVVYTGNTITGSGEGASKKEAEQKAAAESLENLMSREKESLDG